MSNVLPWYRTVSQHACRMQHAPKHAAPWLRRHPGPCPKAGGTLVARRSVAPNQHHAGAAAAPPLAQPAQAARGPGAPRPPRQHHLPRRLVRKGVSHQQPQAPQAARHGVRQPVLARHGRGHGVHRRARAQLGHHARTAVRRRPEHVRLNGVGGAKPHPHRPAAPRVQARQLHCRDLQGHGAQHAPQRSARRAQGRPIRSVPRRAARPGRRRRCKEHQPRLGRARRRHHLHHLQQRRRGPRHAARQRVGHAQLRRVLGPALRPRRLPSHLVQVRGSRRVPSAAPPAQGPHPPVHQPAHAHRALAAAQRDVPRPALPASGLGARCPQRARPRHERFQSRGEAPFGELQRPLQEPRVRAVAARSALRNLQARHRGRPLRGAEAPRRDLAGGTLPDGAASNAAPRELALPQLHSPALQVHPQAQRPSLGSKDRRQGHLHQSRLARLGAEAPQPRASRLQQGALAHRPLPPHRPEVDFRARCPAKLHLQQSNAAARRLQRPLHQPVRARRREPAPPPLPRAALPAALGPRHGHRHEGVGVGPLVGKGAHAHCARPTRRLRRHLRSLLHRNLRRSPPPQARPGRRQGVAHQGVQLPHVRQQGRRPLHQASRRLQDPRRAGSRLSVAAGGLHGPQSQRTAAPAPRQDHARQRADLDGVPQSRPGAVHLQAQNALRRHRAVRNRSPNHRLLRRPVRGRQRARPPVLVHSAPHHRRPRGPRGGRAFQQRQGVARLPSRVTVRAGVQRLASAVRRQHACIGQQARRRPGQSQVHAQDQRSIRDQAVLHVPHSHLEPNQRGRARRVNAQRRPLQSVLE